MGVKFLAEVSELIVLLLLTSPLHAMNSRLGNR
jgi:hypothetical protein